MDGWFNGRQRTVKLSSLNDGRGRLVQMTFLWNLGLERRGREGRGREGRGRGEKTFEKQLSVVVTEAAARRALKTRGLMNCREKCSALS